ELLDADAALPPLAVRADEREPRRAIPSKSLDFENDPLRRMLRHAQYPADEIMLIGPEVNERLLPVPLQLVTKPGEFGEPFAILVHFDGAGCGHLAECLLDF